MKEKINHTINNEYKAVYENIPVGTISLNSTGSVQECNQEGKNLIAKIYQAPVDSFNFFTSGIFLTKNDLSKLDLDKKLSKKLIIKAVGPSNSKLYLKFSIHTLEYNKGISYLVLLTDHSQTATQRKEIEDLNSIIHKAFIESSIGLCRLNLFDNKGFATQTWYDNLYLRERVPILNSFANLPAEDYEYISNYIEEVKKIQFNEQAYLDFAAQDFKKKLTCTVKVKDNAGKAHYLRLYSEISSYHPDNGEILADFITMNIDGQKERETELENTYIKTKEAEELKHAFIANLGDEIHTPLNIITLSCLHLLTNNSPKEGKILYEKVELNTNKLLKIVETIVNSIKEKPAETEIKKTFPAQKTLLIAEDNENNFKLLRYMIKSRYKIEHAWNGHEAVLMYKNMNPDLILMDIKMPIMDGYEATAEIRKTDGSVPIIAVTAYSFNREKESIHGKGFNDYLSKPVNEDDLLKLLKKYL
ncbi:MAG: response regulator [Bacteroidales bacterium]